MCFPSKWLKSNFSEEDKPKASGSQSADTVEKPASKSTAKPVAKPTTNGTTTPTTVPAKKDSKTSKTAIVIYTMYGHIASRASQRSSSIS